MSALMTFLRGPVAGSWACLGLALAACGGGRAPGGTPPPSGPMVASVVVSAGSTAATLTSPGATLQLTATAVDQAGMPVPGATFSWTSDDPAVAMVGATTGLVTAQRSGSARIVAASAGVASTPFPVAVALPVAQVAVAPAAAVIPTGKSFTFGASATDAGGGQVPGLSFLWSSADAVHAAVSASGSVTGALDASGSGALGLGPFAITATETGSGKSGSAAASVAVYPTWSLAAGMAGVTVDVTQGQYVVFANPDTSPYPTTHSVVLDLYPSMTTGPFGPGDSAPLQATLAPGSYAFHCSYHPTMHGTLVIH